MLPKETRTDRETLELVLSSFVAAGNSKRPLQKQADSAYGFLYCFDLTPCCFPLSSVAWLNPVTPGLFFRTSLTYAHDGESRRRAAELLTAINYSLPAGCFALDANDGEVLYKHAVYFGSAPLSVALVRGVLEPSFEFVSMYWEEVLSVVSGSAPPHNHPDG